MGAHELNILPQRDDATVEFNGYRVENVIFVCRFGSHLYGTNGPDSDQDFKAIFIEGIDNILLGCGSQTVNLSTGVKDSKNSSADIDIEFIELRKFVKVI